VKYPPSQAVRYPSSQHASCEVSSIAACQSVQVVRAAIIGVMAPLLRRTGYGLSWREGVVLWWSGLRGAVGLALSLYLLLDDLILDLRYRTVSFLFMGMMAVCSELAPVSRALTSLPC